MKKKVLAVAIASAFIAPSALAAQDTSGMRYTSAAEGFYASIRTRFQTGADTNAGSHIGNSSSRFGVRGNNDLGGGLEGFYQYEAGVDIDNGGGLSTRLGNVGLRGNFGELVAGTYWGNSFNWVYGTTDVANVHSGNLVYNDLYPARFSNSIQYTTPNLSGFQAAIHVTMDSARDGFGTNNTTAVDAAAASAAATAALTDATALGTAATGAEIASTAAAATATTDRNASTAATTAAATAAAAAAAAPADAALAAAAAAAAAAADAAAATATESNNTAATAAAAAATGRIAANDATAADIAAADAAAAADAVTAKDDNDIDQWGLAAQYSVQGFSVAAAYHVNPDGLQKSATNVNTREDLSTYALKAGFAQDNWYINGWYSSDNASDAAGVPSDNEIVSFAAGVSVDKVSLYGVYESKDKAQDSAGDETYSTLGVQYNLGAKSRVWLEYAGRDDDSSTTEDDNINIGLRHDF